MQDEIYAHEDETYSKIYDKYEKLFKTKEEEEEVA